MPGHRLASNSHTHTLSPIRRVSSQEEEQESEEETEGDSDEETLRTEEPAESSDDSEVSEDEAGRAMYKVLQKAVLRKGFEMNSAPAGGKPLRIGEVIGALQVNTFLSTCACGGLSLYLYLLASC